MSVKDKYYPALGYRSAEEMRAIQASIRHKRTVSHEGFTLEEWAYIYRHLLTWVPPMSAITYLHEFIATRRKPR